MEERIKMIANKSFIYNKDINDHIESCKISIEIINTKDEIIKRLRDIIEEKDEKIRNLEEHKLIESNEFRKVIEEQYKLINDLIKKN